MDFLSKELMNDTLIHEVSTSGVNTSNFRCYESLIKACAIKLPKGLTATEQKVLERFATRHQGEMTGCTSNALLMADHVRHISVPERLALIKLVRRGLIKVFKVYAHQCGHRYLWEVVTQETAAAADSTADSKPAFENAHAV